MSGHTVAIFTGDLDVTADAVIIELHRRGVPVFRCDPADFPKSLTIGARFDTTWTGRFQGARHTLDLDDVACAWWRRPGSITIPGDGAETAWVRREAVAGFRGLLATLPWLNHPDDIRAAEHKPLQLATAARAGLAVPATLITNDPAEARAFAAIHGPLIYKPLSGGLLDHGRIVYATPVDPATLDDGVTVTAHLFQHQVPKAYELRTTMVDGREFTARIDARSEAGRRDWRADYQSLTYTPDQLPGPVADQVRAFLRALRLRFAAFDFIVTPDGDHVFLEANPNGQWAWIEHETGLPIAAALADALEGVTHD